MFPLLAAILFKSFGKNVNKKHFPPVGKDFLMVCLLLIPAGIPAVSGGTAFLTAGVR
jgi:hypothetical protein